LGIVAIVLGLIGVFSPKKVLNIITMVVGVVALIIGLA
ncbi:MAG TPA: C4-dicarboxylate ABC transporter, partial [Clostridiaceae bacterium]|nr:C4-dicarboxylate ABC transporter [Clostridiaceae bacterium]